jgi:hypothetical protein
MTRFKLRAMFALGGLIVGAAIWATAGVSQDSPPPQGPAALPRSAATAADDTTERSAVPPARSEATFDPNPPQKPGTNTPNATPLVPGETATERLDRLRANSVAPAAPNGQPTLDVLGRVALDRAGAAPQQPIVGEMPPLRIIPAQGVNASSLKEIVETLIPTARGQIAVDAQTNSLVVRVPDVTFDEIKKLAVNLQEMKPAAPKGNEPPRGRGPRGGSGPGGGSGFGAGLEGVGGAGTFSGMSRGDGGKRLGEPVVAPQVSLAELKRDYERADKAARDFAATMKSNSNRNDDSMASLQNRIAYAFSLRQTFLRVELAEMQRRVTMIQESIDLRDQVAQQIIERRVNELLDPNLQWEPASTPAIGPGGLINSNEVQSPRPMGLPGGTGPGSGSAEGSSSSGKASFTSEAVPIVPSNTGIFSGFSGSKAADPAVSSLSPDRVVQDIREVTLHIESEPKGVDQDIPAIVMEQDPTRTLLLSASWGIEMFLLEKDRRPVISYKVSGADWPVEFVAGDLNLGIAIFSVPTSVSHRLTPWPKDEISEVRVGNFITYEGTSYRVTFLDQVFGRRVQNFELGLNDAFVFGGRIDGNPGAILLRNGKLAGMLVHSVESAAGESKSYALPAKALFDRFHQLLEKNKHPNEKSRSAADVSDARSSGSSYIFDETNAGPRSSGSGDKSDVPSSTATEVAGDVAKPANTGPIWMLHMSAPWRGAERDAPAIVIDANEQRSILLSAAWSAQRFPIGEEGAPIESMTLVGSKRPVRLIAADEQLGVAIYSVPGKLVTWPVNWFSSDVRVGDVLHEAIGGRHVAMPGAARRVESLGNTFVSGSSIPKDAKVAGTFVLEGRMSGNPGSILLKNGLLAGMFLDNSQSTDASGQKPHVLPTKALLEHAHQLIERSEGEARQKLIQR